MKRCSSFNSHHERILGRRTVAVSRQFSSTTSGPIRTGPPRAFAQLKPRIEVRGIQPLGNAILPIGSMPGGDRSSASQSELYSQLQFGTFDDLPPGSAAAAPNGVTVASAWGECEGA